MYEDQEGSCPVERFLDSLPDKHLGKVLQVIQVLEERGPNLPFPYSSQVEGKLRELRAHYGKVQHRFTTSPAVISRINNGGNVELKTLQKMAWALHARLEIELA